MVKILKYLWLLRHTLCGLLLTAFLAERLVSAVAAQSASPPLDRRGGLTLCGGTNNSGTPLRCVDDVRSPISPREEQPSPSDTWTLLRTPNPGGGPDAVSITRPADISGSDLEFAGLMLRCNGAAIDVLIALLRPFPPRSQARVTIEAGPTTTRFVATTVAPGVLLLLPPEAEALASGLWQITPKLVIVIDDGNKPIHGAITLAGLTRAMQKLQANCQIR